MISRVACYLRLPPRSRGSRDGSLAKRQRALSYDAADLQHGGHTLPPSSPTTAVGSLDPRQLEMRQQEEKEFIRSHDTSEATIWYLVDVQWLQEWKLFITRGGNPPGPIDNSRLLDVQTAMPLPGLQPVHDYRGVNVDIWKFWYQRYGGGPVVRRRHLDLYSPTLEDPDFGGATSSGGYLVGEPRLPGSPPQAEVVQPRSFSRRLVAAEPVNGHGSAFVPGFSDEVTNGNGHTERASSMAIRGRTVERRTAAVAPDRNSLRGASAPVSRPAAKSSEEGGQATICCDKCDGPHETSRCPHFKKPREKHADAWSGYGKSSSSKCASDRTPIVRNAKVVQQPADGSCLFHSLSYGLADRSTASSLRRDISSYIAKNPNMTIADTALKEWIRYDSGGSVQSYADRMRGGTWGGGIEMAALTKMRKVNVHVYEKCREGGVEGYRRISAFENPGAQKTISVLYQGRMHYDAIVV